MLQNNKIYCVDVSNVKTSFEFVENNSNRPPFFAKKNVQITYNTCQKKSKRICKIHLGYFGLLTIFRI